jgi:3-phenylpropionate/trans-cinnamate dioxygenase ferredoxin reductase subunit
VLYLRRVGDSDRIKQAFRSASRAVVIGAGWIGLETTAAARAAGVEVTVLEMAELPLLRVLGREVAQVFADLHRDHGVDLRFGVRVAEITGGGAADGVRLSDGTRIDADVVIVGVGVAPNTGLAREAGLEVDDGIRVDERLRTSYPDIYAAGDVANAFHPLLGKHIRVEHWANALHQPQTAAKAMLGRPDAVYDRVPYFFTDQYDLGMEYAGYVEPGGYDQVVFRGDVAGREFLAFWLAGNRVLAAMNVNTWDVNDQLQALVRTARPVDAGTLTDPQVPLESLLP